MGRRSNDRRITPRMPRSLQARIDRVARAEGVSPSQFFATAAAFLAGYETRRLEDAGELERLAQQADGFEQRLVVVEGKFGIRHRQAEPPGPT